MKINNIIGCILLVSCTTIGGGILALPTSTVSAGFIPTTLVFIVCWLFMTIGALLLLEVNLWSTKETNLISMAGNTIGGIGKICSWIAYLMLLYALISAFLAGSGAWLIKLSSDITSINIPEYFGPLVIALFMGTIIYFGTFYADRFNRILAIGLFLFFTILIAITFSHINYDSLANYNVNAVPVTIPLIITTFGFAIIIPSLSTYLNRDSKSLVKVILIGSIIPLACYIVWLLVTLGTLSIDTPNGLKALAAQKANGTQVAIALENIIGNKLTTISARFFSIFAILTTLIGVTLSLYHFLSDGLKIKKQGFGGIILFALTFAPPLIAINTTTEGFNEILSFAGLFVAFILGLLPVLMAWYGRYVRNIAYGFRVPGGKFLLIVSGMFFIYVMLQELMLKKYLFCK